MILISLHVATLLSTLVRRIIDSAATALEPLQKEFARYVAYNPQTPYLQAMSWGEQLVANLTYHKNYIFREPETSSKNVYHEQTSILYPYVSSESIDSGIFSVIGCD